MISRTGKRTLFQLGAALCLAATSATGMAAKDRFFAKYYKDVARQAVRPGPTQVMGEVREGKLHLTERQAVEMALRHNLDANVARHNSLVTARDSQVLKGAYDPMFRFGLNWDRELTPTASVLAGGPSVTNILTNYDFGFSKQFSKGASIEVGFLGLRNRTTNFFSSLVPSINTSFEVLFRQPLLEGFGRIEADYRIEIARNNLDISEQDFKQQLLELVFQVQDSYWELQFALEDIGVKEKSLELAETILEQNRARFEVGTGARLQVVQAEGEAAARREELVRARFNYRTIQDQLIRLITNYRDPRQLGFEIVPLDSVYTPDPVSDDFERLAAVSEEQRPEYQKADLEVANQGVNLELTRDRLKPRLDLVLAYQQFGLGGTQIVRDFSQGFLNPPVVAVIPGGLGDSLSQLFSSDFYGYTLGFNLEIPLLNTQDRASNAQAQISLDRSELNREGVRQQIALEIRNALTQVEMNQARVEASAATVRFADEFLEGEKVRFDVGLGTTRELIEAQRDQVQARSLQIRAQVDLIKSHAQLEKAVGRTLEKLGIDVKDALTINVR